MDEQGCGQREKVPIAVFDFDGTVLDGQSSAALVLQLMRFRIMKIREALPVAWWGVRYKLHLPHEQYGVREHVFGSLMHLSVAEVDELVDEVYRDWIAPAMRERAVDVIDRYLAAGVKVFIVSASFEPIIARVAEGLRVNQISTKMCIRNGRYTAELDGAPVEGHEKNRRLIERADELFGRDGWRLIAAYGDHCTDISLLEMAEHAYAVNPDWLLARTASFNKWPKLTWCEHLSAEQLMRVCPEAKSVDALR